jgi:hypothetical protein
LPRLRADLPFGVISNAIRAAQRSGFRIAHFSVQRDHVHLLVEAADMRALSAGMRGLVIRLARRLNAALRRSGRLWGDRWNGRALGSPREVKNALAYLFFNARKHRELPFGIDGYASSVWAWDCFGDPVYRDGLEALARSREPPVAAPRTWLLRTGWRRHGLLGMRDAAGVGRLRARVLKPVASSRVSGSSSPAC